MSNLSGFVKRLRDIMRNDAGINGDAQRIEQIAWMLFLKVYDAKEQDWEWDDENYQSIIPEECRWQNWAHDDKSSNALTGDRLLDFVNNTLFPTLKNLPVTASTPVKKAIVQTTFADANQYMKDGVLLRQVINVIDELDLSDYEESHAFGEIYETILKELQSAGSAGEFYTPRAVTDFMAQMIKPKIGEKMADFACGTGGFITSWLKELDKQVKTTEDREAYGASVYGMEKKQFPYMLCITNMLLHDLDVPQVFHGNSLLRDVLDYTEEDKFDVILMNPPYGGSEKADVKNHFPSDLASSETADLFMSVIMYRLKKNGRAAVILPDGFLFGTDNAKVNIKKKLLGEFNLHTVVRMPGSVFAPYTSITTNILFFDNTHHTEETWFYRLDMPEGYKHFSKTKPMKLEHFQPVLDWWNDRQEISEDGFDKAKKFTAKELSEDLGYNLDQCGYPHEEEEILAPLDLIHRYEEQRSSLNAEIDRVLAEISNILTINREV
ncbi:MAG TPA: SAM-dependent DNA methyltransferase [Candidatus Faeciplasma pullistercoris]|uniref:site-specific DNA-methyltransferase (adenine-specific) n=1 Tax=Candidatus Faeciplasma pullistercoris TaxID=2840800 RepID=A0A9D1GUH2_9FIRM|nr:SAM-dependent DNA methyltransferase [Candidatus Faeciplasma pullistercoris]